MSEAADWHKEPIGRHHDHKCLDCGSAELTDYFVNTPGRTMNQSVRRPSSLWLLNRQLLDQRGGRGTGAGGAPAEGAVRKEGGDLGRG